MIRIVAFDLSLTSSGWCDGTDVGTLVPPKGADRGLERLDWIRQSVMGKVYGVDLVVIEGYSYGAKGSSFLSLAELGGIIRWSLWDLGTKFVVIPPACRAMFATGKGNARKEEVLAAAIRVLGYDRAQNDEADAMWLWEMAAMRYQLKGSVPHLSEPKRRALSKIEWPTLNQETA